MHKKINKNDIRQKRKPWKLISLQWCCLYAKLMRRFKITSFFLFFGGSFGRHLGSNFLPGIFIEWISLEPLNFESHHLSAKSKKLWTLASISLLWSIWLERKDQNFKDKQLTWFEVWDLFFRAFWWAIKDADFALTPVSVLSRSWASFW